MYYEKLVKEDGLNYDYMKAMLKSSKIIIEKLLKEFKAEEDVLSEKIEILKWELGEENLKQNILKFDNDDIIEKLNQELKELKERHQKVFLDREKLEQYNK